MEQPRPAFASVEAYERSLLDAAFWEPYARAALRMSGLPDDGDVVTHFPTTHVAALVGERYLVKLHYQDWFGEQCFQTERQFYRATRGGGLPVPDLVADGALYRGESGWRWPFLVLGAMRGRDLRSLRGELTRADLERAGRFVGQTLRQLHGIRVEAAGRLSPQIYVDLIRERMAKSAQDHLRWGSLPPRLTEQVGDYVWEARELIDPRLARPVLLHGDLHGGNVFLAASERGHEPSGIIDFNDTYVGDPHYDLVSVHVKAFGCDKRVLRIVLDAYGWERLGDDWPQRMMALSLVHDYDMIEPLVAAFPGALDGVRSLDEVATMLWDLNAPGPAV